MLPNLPRPTWLDVVNDAARRIAANDAGEDEGARRTALLAAVGGSGAFPMRLVFRGLVVGARTLEAPVAMGRSERSQYRVRKVQSFLELVPEGLAREAYDILGGVLVPTDRALQEGSVVTVAVDLWDPGTYHLAPAAMLADLVEMRVSVAVER